MAQAAASLQLQGWTEHPIPFPGISEAQLSHFHTKPNNFCTQHAAPSLGQHRQVYGEMGTGKRTEIYPSVSTGVVRYWFYGTIWG